MTTLEQVRHVLAPLALAPLPADDEASLFDLGVIDSFGLLALARALETEFGIRLPKSDVVPRRLETIARIARLVDARR
ncbi:MAG TPA: acyl carrier protein [Thermoanaerobaculaceae bacterium]|nr:acyl carrier protein [Thermoanaerobaculaceae bacterium]HRS14977.1 acyl carrier protein [Thermoanaerobaculaceae bacterium]